MADKLPILDYETPPPPPPRVPLALGPRIALGIVATLVTLLAAVFVSVGIIYQNAAQFLFGCFTSLLAYFLWKPVRRP